MSRKCVVRALRSASPHPPAPCTCPPLPQVRAEDADGFYTSMRNVPRQEGPLQPGVGAVPGG